MTAKKNNRNIRKAKAVANKIKAAAKKSRNTVTKQAKAFNAKHGSQIREDNLRDYEQKFRKAARDGFKALMQKGEAVFDAYAYHKKHKHTVVEFETWCQSRLGITKNEAHMYRKLPKLWTSLSPDLQPLADLMALTEIAKKDEHESVIWRNAYIRELVKGLDRVEDYPSGWFVAWNGFRWSQWGKTRVELVKAAKVAAQTPYRRVQVTSGVEGVVISIRVLGLNGKQPTKKQAEAKAKKALAGCVVTAVE